MPQLLADQLTALRAMLADLAAFQTWTGTGDATAALDHVHRYEAFGAVDHPLAVVNIDGLRREKLIDDTFTYPSGGASGSARITFRALGSTREGAPSDRLSLDTSIDAIMAAFEGASVGDQFEAVAWEVGAMTVKSGKDRASGEDAPKSYIERTVRLVWRGM